MTKAELAAENARLRAENAALRDLLAAVRETASAGETARGDDGCMYFQAAYRAAQRTSIWLEGISGYDAQRLAYIAADFRRHIGDITALCPAGKATAA